MTKLTVAVRSGIHTICEEDAEFLNVKPGGTLRHSVGRVVAYFYSPKPTFIPLNLQQFLCVFLAVSLETYEYSSSARFGM